MKIFIVRYFSYFVLLFYINNLSSQKILHFSPQLKEKLLSTYDYNSDNEISEEESYEITELSMDVDSSIYGIDQLKTLRRLTLRVKANAVIGDDVLNSQSLHSLDISKKDNKTKYLILLPKVINLPKLNHLTLRDVQIDFTVKNLQAIKFVQIDGSKILNNFIESLFTANNLNALRINNCGIDKFPDISVDSKIKTLSISEGKIDIIPSSINRLKQLKYLNLNNNIISSLPPSIAQLDSLETLELSNNKFNLFPDVINKLSSLKHLKFKQDNIIVEPSKDLSALERLEELPIEINFKNGIPTFVFDFVGLKKLNLSNLKLTKLPKELSQLINLESLDVSGNLLTKIPEEIKGLQNLKALNLSYNKITSLPAWVSKLEKLEGLNLNANLLEKISLDFSLMLHLKSFSAENNALTEFPYDLGKCRNLESLLLNGNKIQNFNLLKEGDFPGLKSFSIKNNILNQIPPTIQYLENLNYLNLDGNQLTTFPYEFNNLRSNCKISWNNVELSIQDFCSKNFKIINDTMVYDKLFENHGCYDRQNLIASLFDERDVIFTGYVLKSFSQCGLENIYEIKIEKCYTNNCLKDTILLELYHNYLGSKVLIVYGINNEINPTITNYHDARISSCDKAGSVDYMEKIELLENFEHFIVSKHNGNASFYFQKRKIATGEFINGIPNGKWTSYFNTSNGEDLVKKDWVVDSGKKIGKEMIYSLSAGIHLPSKIKTYENNEVVKEEEFVFNKDDLYDIKNIGSTVNTYNKKISFIDIQKIYLSKKTTTSNNFDTTKMWTNRALNVHNNKQPFDFPSWLNGYSVNYSGSSRGHYNDGRKVGVWKKILADGSVDSFIYNSKIKKGKATYEIYNHNNLSHLFFNLKDNMPDGIVLIYNYDGKIEKTLNYDRGKLNGFSKYLPVSGDSIICEFKEGLKHGVEIGYNKNGAYIKNYNGGYDWGNKVNISVGNLNLVVDSIVYARDCNYKLISNTYSKPSNFKLLIDNKGQIDLHNLKLINSEIKYKPLYKKFHFEYNSVVTKKFLCELGLYKLLD